MATNPAKKRGKGKAMGNKTAYYANQFFVTEKNLKRKGKTNKKSKQVK